MLPGRLSLKNFCGHADTEFSFDDFQSALVIGKVKDNDRFSNGAGKSTIFNAIEYVLFNEIQFSALEKIIRDGCDVCRVEFDFTSSLDKSIYRIVRSNSRKTGTDVRLFKKDNDEWQDLTQRRVSDTEKEIVKIVGFNYKAFCASVLFSQSGSENNVQKDFGNLPNLTPEKRKSVLREVLQLNVYANYEKLAKNKFSNVQYNLEKQKVILTTIGDPDTLLVSLTKEQEESDKILTIYNKNISFIKDKLASLKSEYTLLSDKVSGSRAKISSITNTESICKDGIAKSHKTIEDLKLKIASLPKEAKDIQKELDSMQSWVDEHKKEQIDIEPLNIDASKLLEKFLSAKNALIIVKVKLEELNNPITEEKNCSHCHQNISEEHKHNWTIKNKEEILKLEKDKITLNKDLLELADSRAEVDTLIGTRIAIKNTLSTWESKIDYLSKELEAKRLLYKNYNVLLEDHIVSLRSKNIELETIQQELSALIVLDKNNLTFNRLDELRLDITKSSNKETQLSSEISNLIGKQAIIKHKVEQSILNRIKIIDLKKDIQELEKSLQLHSKVIQAFGSNGIPSLITHSILDELQGEANKWLLKLRPGLQLQFVVINDKNTNKDKDKEDTLDILYFIDGNQREYKQLSGAQKIIVSLSLKLAILFIINKRLGVDIKLMLLDEVNQPLDPGSTEIFAEIIKVIQNELKVLVITHDENLKYKFSHTILIEQDENNVSKGRLCINTH